MAPSASPSSSAGAMPSKHHHIWLVTGPGGCGKTTVAEFLAKSTGMPYLEGDSVCNDRAWIEVNP
jgi:gluconokinase